MDENECVTKAKEWCDNIMNVSTTSDNTASNGMVYNGTTSSENYFIPYYDKTVTFQPPQEPPGCFNYFDYSTIKIEQAYGLYITLDGEIDELSKSINKCDAENITEVVVNWMGVKKEFKYSEFLKLLGFDIKEKEDVSDEIKRGLDYIFNN